MVDPEDNFKGVLAEIAMDRAVRKARLAMVWMLLGILFSCASIVGAILAAHTTFVVLFLLTTASGALITGVLMGRAEHAAEAREKAKDVHRQWQEEIQLQSRIDEREREDGESA